MVKSTQQTVKKITHPIRHFWATDLSLTVLLVLLFISIFVITPLHHAGELQAFLISEIIFSLILVTGVMSVAKYRSITFLAVVFALASFVVRWMRILLPVEKLVLLDNLMSMLFMGVLALVVLIQVLREGPVTMHRIMGAVVVYLLLGLMWAFAYDLVELLRPQSFVAEGSPISVLNNEIPPPKLLYFSFATLTTVGYGDITAANPIARSLAVLEALVGQLFPVILIARLVSMELFHRQLRKEAGKDRSSSQ